jgi:hypothetical protein
MMKLFTFLAITVVSGQPNSCDPGFKWDGSTCVPDRVITCSPPTPYKYESGCYERCPSGTVVISEDGTCGACPTGTFITADGNCGEQSTCPTGTYTAADGRCVDYGYGNQTVPCGSNQYMNSNGTCVDYNTCASNQYLDADGKCHDYQHTCPFWFNKTCVSECPKGTLVTAWNSCVDSCPDNMIRNDTACVFTCESGASYNGTCVSACPREAPVSFYGKCVDRCPAGTYDMGNSVCEYGCPGFYLDDACVDRCPAGMVVIYDKHCVERCPSSMIQNGTRCESHCQSTQYYMDGVCNDYGSSSNSTCPDGLIRADGKCVDYGSGGNWTSNPCPTGQYMTSAGNCMKPCASDQWYWNNTCVPACKEGEALTMDGTCINMAALCRDALPGSIMNNVSRTCECPAGQWITRDLEATAKMPVRCSPGGPDRIDCRSFVANTVYDATLNTCVCNADNPVVVPVADATWFPYTCAPAGSATTIKQCVAPEYFDFMEGHCVHADLSNSTVNPTVRPSASAKPTASMTIKPSSSAKPSCDPSTDDTCMRPTRTAMPSRYPSASSTITHTPKPSAIPGSPSPSTSASRSVKPSALIFADVTRKPLPSLQTVRPPPADVRKSPAPSSWPKKVVMEIPSEEKPAYIDARMTVAGGNATEMAKPERVQQMQASLACTLRIPLENIRIQNITTTDAAGRKSRIPIDPATVMMVGDGSTECYDFSANRRMLRSLTATGGAIEVDYTIVNPTDAILTMDTTQFNDVISQSPIMIAAAISVGGTGASAQAVDSQKVDAPVPSASASASASPQGIILSSTGVGSSILDMRTATGIGIGGVALLGLATVMATFYYKESKKAKRLLREANAKAKATETNGNPRVVMVYSDEKHHMTNPLSVHRVESTRLDYGPETTRRSMGPVKATHGVLFGSAV